MDIFEPAIYISADIAPEAGSNQVTGWLLCCTSVY